MKLIRIFALCLAGFFAVAGCAGQEEAYVGDIEGGH